MKKVRIWMLLLLAALIPVRGAMAVTMLCLPASSGQQSELAAQRHTHHEGMGHEASPSAAHVVDSSEHGSAHHAAGESGKCTLCSACCSSASMLSSVPAVMAPLDLSTASFPDLSGPAPTFLSDGQERPPRSI